MKKLLALLLVLSLLLSGCASNSEAEDTKTTVPSTAPSAPPEQPEEENFGIYESESAVEVATAGAVKQYALEGWDYYGLCTMGDGLLLLSGQRDTTLTYIAPDGTTASVTIKDQAVFPEDLILIGEGDHVAYYDATAMAMIRLDSSLKMVEKVNVPENATGAPVVTADWKRLYYATETALRFVDIETGIDRLLKEMSFPLQCVEMLHFDGFVLECFVDDGFSVRTLLISTETGELLYESEDTPVLNTDADRYFVQLNENGIPQYLFGIRGEKPQSLNVEQIHLNAPQMGIAASWKSIANGINLRCYDLEAGTCFSETTLPFTDDILWACADAQRESLWFISRNEEQESQLYRWDLTMSFTEDSTSYVTPYYTQDEPDREGLARIEQWAQEIGRKYGLKVHVYEEALRYQPSDYTFALQHQVPVYDRYLTQLETALARYPEGFFRKLGSTSHNGKLTIGLVRTMYGDNQLGSVDTADGVHFYKDGSVYITLATGSAFEATLYHELFHAIDTYVMSRNNLYDFWEDLNPPGFAYDNDYVSNQFREDYQYLEGDRWFIDMYSMSYAKEDRARIMEYAMQADKGEYFESPHMRAKLAKLSEGIRKAFGLKSGNLPWEQYLK